MATLISPETAAGWARMEEAALKAGAETSTSIGAEAASGTFLGLTGIGWSMGITAVADVWCSLVASSYASDLAKLQKDTIGVQKDSQIQSMKDNEKLAGKELKGKKDLAQHEKKCIAVVEGAQDALGNSEKALAESEGRIAIADARYNNAEKVRKAGDINEKKLRQMFDYRGEYKYGTAKTKNDPNLKPTSA